MNYFGQDHYDTPEVIDEDKSTSWFGESADDCYQIKDNWTGEVVAEVFSPDLAMEQDIHLMAQAPEMLQALQEILKTAEKANDFESFKWRVQHLAKMEIIKLERAQA